MIGNSDGLSPTLRPQLGIGWNRALPAPFGFDNCVKLDGVNDYFSIPGIVGQAFPSAFTIEYFIKKDTSNGWLRFFSVGDATNLKGLTNQLLPGTFAQLRATYNNSASASSTNVTWTNANPFHVVFTVSASVSGTKTLNLYVDGALSGTNTIADTYFPLLISYFELLVYRDSPDLQSSSKAYSSAVKLDEARFYNRVISLSEVQLNYNNGVGNNPAQTEGLIFWYDFQEAFADTALYPTGNPSGWTSGAWGVRDKTSNGYHAMQVNMANNATLGGAIQTF